MTEEELEKEAGEYAKPFYNMTRYDYVEERTHIKEAYLAGAEPREKRIIELKEENNKLLDVINNQDVKIADLEKKLEKMKCCENCNEWYRLPTGQKDCAETNCEKLSHWTMRIKE